MTKQSLEQEIYFASTIDDLDLSCGHIQSILGITDGGIASICFSDVSETDWRKMSHDARYDKLKDYIKTEISYMEYYE